MKGLVIGLGSMGKRRIRNLIHIGDIEVLGFDKRSDRLKEAKDKYSIEVSDDFDDLVKRHHFDFFVISTSPESHMKYAYIAHSMNISAFIEASVVEKEKIFELYNLSKKTNLIFAPSCTMCFFDGPKKVKELIQCGAIGKVATFNYHTGQYLPDWHPWESIHDFYVSKRDTGAAREIVPFELTWLNDIFGQPRVINSYYLNTGIVDADIDDFYTALLDYNGVIANITVEVISKNRATRYLRVLGDGGQIIFDGDENIVKYVNDKSKEWKVTELAKGTVESGYINPENPYIEEMQCFINAVRQGDLQFYPNNLKKDYEILCQLEAIERAK